MVLTYTVELKTSATFTGSKSVKNENEARFAVEKMKETNNKKGYAMYSGFKLYDQLNVINKQPQLISQWP